MAGANNAEDARKAQFVRDFNRVMPFGVQFGPDVRAVLRVEADVDDRGGGRQIGQRKAVADFEDVFVDGFYVYLKIFFVVGSTNGDTFDS